MAATWVHPTPARRRVRVATAILKRVRVQQDKLAQRYAVATTPHDRLGAVIDAVRAAAAPGHHQPDQQATEREIENLVDVLTLTLNRLHAAQQAAAQKVLIDDERRIRRVRTEHAPGRTANPTAAPAAAVAGYAPASGV